jgi:hypothetical protein
MWPVSEEEKNLTTRSIDSSYAFPVVHQDYQFEFGGDFFYG